MFGIKLDALRSNLQECRDPASVKLRQRMRWVIETVIGQLVERFHLEKVWAGSVALNQPSQSQVIGSYSVPVAQPP